VSCALHRSGLDTTNRKALQRGLSATVRKEELKLVSIIKQELTKPLSSLFHILCEYHLIWILLTADLRLLSLNKKKKKVRI
jgi:hypothetical protein